MGLIIKRCSDPFIGVEMREIAVFPEFDMKVTVVHLENEKEIKTENFTLIGGQVNYIPIKVKTTAQEYQIYIDFCGHRIKGSQIVHAVRKGIVIAIIVQTFILFMRKLMNLRKVVIFIWGFRSFAGAHLIT